MHISVKVSEGSEDTVHAQKETAKLQYREIKENSHNKKEEIQFGEASVKHPISEKFICTVSVTNPAEVRKK